MHGDGMDREENRMNEQRLGELMLKLERTYASTPKKDGTGMLRPPLPCDQEQSKRKSEVRYEERANLRHNIFSDIHSKFDEGIAFDSLDVIKKLPHLNKMAASNYLKRMVSEGYLNRLVFSSGNRPNVYMKTGKKMATYDLVVNEKAWTKHGRN